MANYSYQSSNLSSGGGGSSSVEAAFNAADANRDGRVDINEFRSFIGKSIFLSIIACVSINNNC
jgi:hypothetical protein